MTELEKDLLERVIDLSVKVRELETFLQDSDCAISDQYDFIKDQDAEISGLKQELTAVRSNYEERCIKVAALLQECERLRSVVDTLEQKA